VTCYLCSVSLGELAAPPAPGPTHEGRKRRHRADEIMEGIVAGELVWLEAAGFVVMRKPAMEGIPGLAEVTGRQSRLLDPPTPFFSGTE
jgi:hypothetical protein